MPESHQNGHLERAPGDRAPDNRALYRPEKEGQ